MPAQLPRLAGALYRATSGTFCGLGCPLGRFLTASPPSRTLTSSGQLVLARQAPWERLGGGTTFCGPPGWPLSCPSWSPMSPSGRATAVAAIQDILGDRQDTVVAEAWLRNTGAALPPACVAAGALVTSVRLERARPRSDRPKAWKRTSARSISPTRYRRPCSPRRRFCQQASRRQLGGPWTAVADRGE
jgi:hypothetical protein